MALIAVCAPVVFAQDSESRVPTCANTFTNLGFESGDFTGWTAVDMANPFWPIAVRGAGTIPAGDPRFFATAPTEGIRVMSHGFDGAGPGTIVLHQDLAVPKTPFTMQFDFRAGWNLPGASQARVFSVDIEPVGGGTPLQTTTVLTANAGTVVWDTGPLRGSVPLADFMGQTVRVSLEWLVPQNYSGPGHFQLDNVMPLLPVAVSVDGNGVFEPGETVTFKPVWLNCSTLAKSTTGRALAFTGPAGPTYTIIDDSANYGGIPAGAAQECGTGDCYVLSVSGARPSMHWDASLTEQLSQPGLLDRAVHMGGSFTDVPASSPFYRFVETLLHHGVTGGCAPDFYCPASSTTRDQMAAFVLVAREGVGYNPPACGTPMFGDVPASSPFCKWIEELARRGVVSGCGGGNYCPAAAVTREQMAVFVLRTLEPALSPPACGTPMFGDVPASNPFCKWIEELARRGVVSGCGGGNYCPADPVAREQMGVFLSATFGLTLYGP